MRKFKTKKDKLAKEKKHGQWRAWYIRNKEKKHAMNRAYYARNHQKMVSLPGKMAEIG